jgi:2,3-dihydroxybenzoate-AMP ligase
MLNGCVPWPEEFARRYIEAGLWEGITVAEMVEQTARRQPQKTALVHGEARITYEELIRSAKRVASGLFRLGLRPQDRIVVQLPNCPEFVTDPCGTDRGRNGRPGGSLNRAESMLP